MFGLDTLVGAAIAIGLTAGWSWLRRKKPAWAKAIGSKENLFRRVWEMVEFLAPTLGLSSRQKLELYEQRIKEWSASYGVPLAASDIQTARLWAEQWAAEDKRAKPAHIADVFRELQTEATRTAVALEHARAQVRAQPPASPEPDDRPSRGIALSRARELREASGLLDDSEDLT